ncbi:MAG TPA: WGR domain-containing protein [Kofleriaceae bacterium]|nr:WGR domain-containing protein [Kofleriaceae bacterium]
MPRYEFSQGTSNKFWEINLASKSFTTTYGKIGANGQTTIKKFSSDADAKKEHDKLVAEKVKKGYVLVGAKPAKPAKTAKGTPAKGTPVESFVRDARNPALEAAIVANPTDRDAYAVFGDWLQEQGDPRGELISLQLAYKDKQAKALIEKHADYFLGPLAENQQVHDEGWNNSRSHLRTPAQEKEWQKVHREAFLWRNGFIHRVRLSHDEYSDESFEGETVDILEQVLSHPSGRYVVEFAFMSNGDPNENDLQDLIDLLGKKAPPTVRKLTFGDNVDQISWHHTGNLGKLWKGVPKLRVLELETGEFEVGKMVAPELERAVFITGGLSKSCGKNIATATMPKIKHLEIYYGTNRYGGQCSIKEVKPLLDRSDLKQLEYLGLKNSEFANDIARALAGAKVLKTVNTLDLSLGTMTDEGAKALVAAKDSLAHLECLDLTRNYLSKDGVKLVKNLCKKVITDKQQTADVYGDETYYYVAISE